MSAAVLQKAGKTRFKRGVIVLPPNSPQRIVLNPSKGFRAFLHSHPELLRIKSRKSIFLVVEDLCRFAAPDPIGAHTDHSGFWSGLLRSVPSAFVSDSA
jgi:hypothetical protein